MIVNKESLLYKSRFLFFTFLQEVKEDLYDSILDQIDGQVWSNYQGDVNV